MKRFVVPSDAVEEAPSLGCVGVTFTFQLKMEASYFKNGVPVHGH